MKINYPIKYAAMPIIEEVGRTFGLHELEREYGVVLYIVSKCYLIKNTTTYKENGSSVKEYEVVFPYQPFEYGWEKNLPRYSIYGNCINSTMVDLVFDSYEEALNYVDIKNRDLCDDNIRYISIEKAKMYEEEFITKLSKYQILEQQILNYTSDLKIGENQKLNNVVQVRNNNIKILKDSIYYLLNILNGYKFVVYSISNEQYADLLNYNSLEKIDYINNLRGKVKGLLIRKKQDDFIKLSPLSEGGTYYINDDSICFDDKIEKVSIDDFEQIDDDTLVFYTTETLEDLFNSYKKYPEIDLDNLQGPVLTKIKK